MDICHDHIYFGGLFSPFEPPIVYFFFEIVIIKLNNVGIDAHIYLTSNYKVLHNPSINVIIKFKT
jgi:hypothetical protein